MNPEPVQVETHSPEETERLGATLAEKLQQGDVLALYGTLGSGKTTFVRGLARELGITEPIRSPTFTLIHEYPLPDQRARLYHIDLYRLENPEQVHELGLEELFPKGITVIEWADRAPNLLPDDRIEIHFEVSEGDTRQIMLSKPTR
jgi:tRNA threonylcarbamoyladenosine biosynthesis protein TsaE